MKTQTMTYPCGGRQGIRRAVAGALFFLLLCPGSLLPENRVLNPGFEAGLYGWTWDLSPWPQDAAVSVDRQSLPDTPEPGDSVLKIVLGKDGAGAAVVSGPTGLSKDREQTISFYGKGSGQVSLSVVVKAPGRGADEQPVELLSTEPVSLSETWQRFAFRFSTALPRRPAARQTPSADRVVIVVRAETAGGPGIVWLDGFCLAEGTAEGYDDGPEVFGAAIPERPGNVYLPGEAVNPSFRFHCGRTPAPADCAARYRTEETLTGRIVGERTLPLFFGENRRYTEQKCPYTLPSDRRGLFRTVVVVVSGNREVSRSEFIHAVHEPTVPPAAGKERFFGIQGVFPGLRRSPAGHYLQMASGTGAGMFRYGDAVSSEHPAPGEFRFGMDREGSRSRVLAEAEKYRLGMSSWIGPGTHADIPDWMRTARYSETPDYHDNRDPAGRILPLWETWGRTLDRAALQQYGKALGETFRGKIRFWEIFPGSYGIAEYPEYCAALSGALRSAAPDSRIVVHLTREQAAGDVPVVRGIHRQRFLTQAMANAADVLAFPALPPCGSAATEAEGAGVRDLQSTWRAFLRECSRPDAEIWAMDPGCAAPSYYAHRAQVSPDTDRRALQVAQAARVVRACVLCRDAGYDRLFLPGLAGSGETLSDEGMLEYDDTPRMAYLAACHAVRRLNAAVPLGRILLPVRKVQAYLFRTGRRDVLAVVWTSDGTPGELRIPAAGQVSAEDMAGNPLLLRTEEEDTAVPIGGAPVYVVLADQGMSPSGQAGMVELLKNARVLGMDPLECGLELDRNPATGRTCLAVGIRNTSDREYNGVFRLAGLPEGWKAGVDRLCIGPVAAYGQSAGYVDIQPEQEAGPLRIAAFHYHGGSMAETGRTILRLEPVARRKDILKLDGDIRESAWDAAGGGLSIAAAEQVLLEREPETLLVRTSVLDWKPGEFSSVHRVLWDDQALYVASRVKTPWFVQKKKDVSLLEDSNSVEIFLRFPDRPGQPGADYHVTVAPATPGNPRVLSRMLKGRGRIPVNLEGFRAASHQVGAGYEMEIGIPWKSIPEAAGIGPGSVIGLNIAVNSAFQDGNRRWRMAWCGDGSDSGGLAHAVLVDSLEKAVPELPRAGRKVPPEGMPVEMECREPGIYGIRWKYRTSADEKTPAGLGLQGCSAPLRVLLPAAGREGEIEYLYGATSGWTQAHCFVRVETPGTHTARFRTEGSASGGNVRVDDVSVFRCGPADFERENLLDDGGFEQGCADFALRAGEETGEGVATAALGLDRAVFFDGRQSFRMDVRDRFADVYTRPFPLRRGRVYRMDMLVRSSRQEAGEFQASVWPAEGAVAAVSTGLPTAGRWRSVTLRFEVPAESSMPEEDLFRIRLRAIRSGTCWVDSLRLYPVSGRSSGTFSESLRLPWREPSGVGYNLLNLPDPRLLAAYDDPWEYTEGKSSLRLENHSVAAVGGGLSREPLLLNLQSGPFALESEKVYDLSFWARSETAAVRVWTEIVAFGSPAVFSGEPFRAGVVRLLGEGTGLEPGWNRYRFRFRVPPGAGRNFVHRVIFAGPAVVWLDDLLLVPASSGGGHRQTDTR